MERASCGRHYQSPLLQRKNAPNVTVLGGITGGGGGIPTSNELPNGWMVRFSSVQILDVYRRQIEFGIAPDVEVTMNAIDVANGFDTLIEQAIAFILK